MNLEETKIYIKQHFRYNPDGTLDRDDYKNCKGHLDKDGYLIIKVKQRAFKAHRVVWLLNNGDFPHAELDHINRVRTDNRIENLRESSRKEQAANTTKRPNKDTGEVGIYLDKSTKGLKKVYTFRHEGKTYRYRTLDEAKEARQCIKGLQLCREN